MNETPSTGYQWIIPEERERYNYIWSLFSSDYIPNNDRKRFGVSGKRQFIIKIDKIGYEHFTLVYGREWKYNEAVDNYVQNGIFDPKIMEGIAIQLVINSTKPDAT